MATLNHDEGKLNLHPFSTVHEFPVNTFVENIAVRRTGQLLVTIHNQNELVTIDPNVPGSPPAQVHVFGEGVSGIVEMGEDSFFVSSGTIGTKGTWSVYKIDMSKFAIDPSGRVVSPAAVEKLVDIPDALFLNGSAAMNFNKGVIAVADSLLGAVFCIDVQTAEAKLWLQHKLFEKATDNPMIPGLNGIKRHRGYLYCSNTDAGTVLRASISGTGEATGVVEVLEKNLNFDDFTFDSNDSAYLTTHIFQSVVKLHSNGARERIAGGPEDSVTAGTTAAAFGRTAHDRTSLYVTTTGGMSLPVNGKIAPARILKIEVGHTEDLDLRLS